ncbi:MAG: hypothetical protein OQL19_09740 [Gammaproteobacteria bacterium]|nr:hypothetical protein [Gammaproteobacteria bacterium]
MNAVDGAGVSNYLSVVQQATKRNTLSQVIDAKQSGQTVDVEQLQSSNQVLRDTARETGVVLYTQQLQKQAFETYVNTSQNNSYNTTANDDKGSDVYTFDAAQVNDNLQTVQKRALGVAYYENLSDQADRPEFHKPSTLPVNVYA